MARPGLPTQVGQAGRDVAVVQRGLDLVLRYDLDAQRAQGLFGLGTDLLPDVPRTAGHLHYQHPRRRHRRTAEKSGKQ